MRKFIQCVYILAYTMLIILSVGLIVKYPVFIILFGVGLSFLLEKKEK